MSLLDEFVYPWSSADAQELHITLARLHSYDGLLIAQKAGVETMMISNQLAPAMLWKQILDEAAKSGLTRDVVRVVYDGLNVKSPVRPFLGEILAGHTVATSGEPRDAEGAPAFLEDDDIVTEDEARLFGDDLSVPIGRLPSFIDTLQKLSLIAPSVCKLTADIQGDVQFGTAFRIADKLVLTNWHVVHRKQDQAPANAINAEFGFEDDGKGGLLAPTVIVCNPDTVVSSRENDWATIECVDGLRPEWPALPLSEASIPTMASSAFIIQHPCGERKRVAVVRNRVTRVTDRVIHYVTDTAAGSSGSPVLDADGRLIALHHAGGRPELVMGKQPMLKNEGIRISAVVNDLDANGLKYA